MAPTTCTPPAALYRTGLSYTDRPSKARYIADKYAQILRGSVLDVGCDRAPLRTLVADPSRYVGLDINPEADITMDLERDGLPFPDRSFDTVLCTDVLEHLARCHAVFDQLCRVADARVVVSLPNPLRALIQGLYAGSGGHLKYYGLPTDPPADRHKWFFGHEDAARFLTERGRRNGFAVEQLDTEDSAGPYWLNGRGEDVLDHPNIRAGTLWCVLRRD
jgi:hypothetical protein